MNFTIKKLLNEPYLITKYIEEHYAIVQHVKNIQKNKRH